MTDNPNENVNNHLKQFIEENDPQANMNKAPLENPNIQNFGPNTKQKVAYIEADSNYISIELDQLPFGRFYIPGTRIQVRPLKTKEIESFAVINEKNAFDVKQKLNEVLKACVKIIFPDGSYGTYRDIKDGDRDTISIILSKMSKKHGAKLEKEVACKCGINQPTKIELLPANYVYKQENPKLTKWFNEDSRTYTFVLKSGAPVSLAPPTIGITEDVDAYILSQALKSGGKTSPNITFMQCITYMLAGRGVKSMDPEKMAQEEFNFTKLNEDLFQFIYDTVDMISFGIEEIKTLCQGCGEEVRTSFGFPKGARDLFMLSNAFDELIG